MKVSFYVIIDNLFKFFLIFILNIIWCLYFINTSSISIVVAFFITIIMLFLLNIISKKRNGKKHLSLKKQQHIKDVTNTFLYMSNSELLIFFKSLIKTKHLCRIENNYILVETSALPILVFPKFNFSNLTANDVLKFYKSIKHKNLKRLVILTNKFDAEINSIITNFKFETIILDNTQTYLNLLENYNFYPEIKPAKKPKPQTKLNTFLNIALNKKRTKTYVLSAIFLIFSSFFVIYKAYYLLFSSILIMLAIFSYFKPKVSSPKNINVLN